MERRKITDAIVIHCSATPEGRDHGVDDIKAWHKARGFEDVGYHYVVRLDGSVEVGRGEGFVGAHCVESGMNRRSIGVCYVGGMDKAMKAPKDTRTAAQRRSLAELVKRLQGKYRIPDSRVFGHRDFAKKACPSFDVRTMFMVVLAVVSVFASACTRKVYVPLETRGVKVDTVYVSRNSAERLADRDTIRIREGGDTVKVEAVKWRWRERIVADTVFRTVRDSVFVKERQAVAGGGEMSWGSGFRNMLLAVLIAVGLILVLRRYK